MKKSNTSKSQSKTEIALKESEQRYRTAMMSVGDGVIATDTEGRVEMMNPVAEGLTGWKKEEARGKSLEEIFHIINEETRRPVENPVHQMIREGMMVGLANHSLLISKDGMEHSIANSGAPIRNEKGDITGVVLVFRDQTQERAAHYLSMVEERTERKRMEESLVTERRFLRQIIDTVPAFICVKTAAGPYALANESLAKAYGTTVSSVEGKSDLDFSPTPEEAAAFRKDDLEVINGRLTKTIAEEPITYADGTVHWYSTTKIPIIDPDRSCSNVLVVAMDITELREHREHLQELVERRTAELTASQAALVEAQAVAHMGSWEWDAIGDGITGSDEFYRLFDVAPKDLTRFPQFIDRLHPDDRERVQRAVADALQQDQPYDTDYRVKLGDDGWRNINARGRVFTDTAGKAVSMVGTCLDITERKLAEKQLRKLNRIYSILSDINQAIVRTRVSKELFEKVCSIAVEQGGFSMAWIGLTDESSQKLQLIAQAGRTNGFFEQISDCPIDSALRQGKHIIRNIIENEKMAPSQKIAYDLGFRSSASFPLKVSDILKGAVTFYSGEPEFFDIEELKLLDELALDISFAMEYAEKEAGRKQAEEALHESEVKYRELFGNAQVGMYRSKLDGSALLAVNSKLCEIFGYTEEEMLSNPATIRWADPLARDRMVTELRQVGFLHDYAMNIVTKSGEIRNCLVSVQLNVDKGYLEGSAIDITERKWAEETLRESEAKYRTLVENIPQGIFMKDRNYRWVSINENFARNLSVRPEDIVGKVDRDLFPRDIADKYHADDIRIMEKGQTEEFEEESFLDGKHVWVNTIKTPVRDEKDEIVGVLGIFWDITERKLAEERLRKLNAELERSNKELEQFAYVASHDLQEPLRMVSSFTQLLAKRYHDHLDKEANEFIEYIIDGANRMQRLIQDLLSYSRITTRGGILNMVDTRKALGEAISNLQILIKESGTIITIDDLPQVVADYGQLVQLFQNLIGNSIKFHGEESPLVHISSELKDNEWVFSIKDNGIGIDSIYFDRVFTIFQRLHSGKQYPGTGIGLAICNRIVQRHGGKIWVESELGKGSTFHFKLIK
jgi:PAS domain S-box-containing protein